MGQGLRCCARALWCGVWLLACRSAPPPPAVAPAPVLPPGAGDVAALRGHPFKRGVPVFEVSRARIRNVLASDEKRYVNGGGEVFLKAFGFMSEKAHLSEDVTLREQGDSLVGLYEPRPRAIYVRPRTRTSLAIDPDDVLHELAHALQDDVFGLDAMWADGGAGGDDARLAHRAVYEGDATVVAWGIAGQRAGIEADDAISDHRVGALAAAATLGAAQELETMPGLGQQSPLTQAETFFPYTAGAEFVAEAWLAGGASLVDGVFRKLPTSTEQVLHAAKYFEGEAPVPVRVPSAPPGYVVLDHGTMGELRTRAFLELTVSSTKAIAASSGWGGDTYAVVAREGTTAPLSILWSTVWDDETHARAFEAALGEVGKASPVKPTQLARRGLRVSWTRGVGDTATVAALLDLPGDPPPNRPPHGLVVLPSTQLGHQLVRRTNDDAPLLVPVLGLSVPLPSRYVALRPGVRDFVLQDPERTGSGSIWHSSTPFEPKTFSTTASLVSMILSSSLPLGSPTYADVSLPIGAGKEARWPILQGGEVHLFVVPMCNGKASVSITTWATREESRVALAQWVRSIEPTGAALPPVCTIKNP